MFKRFLFPDDLVRRGFIPSFRLSDYLDQLDVTEQAHIEFAGNVLLLRSRDQEELTGEELVLQPCAQSNTPAVIVSTLKQHGCNRPPFATFDTQVRQLLRFAHDRPRDHRLELNFAVSCGVMGLKPCEVRRNIVDQITDSREGLGIMFTGGRSSFDPEQAHALVCVTEVPPRAGSADQSIIRVLCRGSTVQQLLGAWDAIIRRLRPQFREPQWNAAMLMTLLLDMGRGGRTLQLAELQRGFALPWAAPEWLEIPNDISSESLGQVVGHHTIEIPRQHFWTEPLPQWLHGRTFRLSRARGAMNVRWA